MRKYTDQNNPEYGQFLRSVTCHVSYFRKNFFARTKSRIAKNHVPVIKYIKEGTGEFLQILGLQPQKRYL